MYGGGGKHTHTYTNIHRTAVLGLLRYEGDLVRRFVVCRVDGGKRVIRVEDPADLFGGEEIGLFTAAEGLSLSSAGPSSFLVGCCGTEDI